MTFGVILLLILIFIIPSKINKRVTSKKRASNLKLLSDSRIKFTKKDYFKYFINLGFNKDHIEVVYYNILEFIGFKDFNLYPEDNILEYFRDDLNDVIFLEDICHHLNLKKYTQKDFDLYTNEPRDFNAEFILNFIKYLEEKEKTNP